jgi:hypothetical protein
MLSLMGVTSGRTPPGANATPLERLQHLQEVRGFLTADEYDEKRKEILDSI